jgi:hypothetical protein
MSDLFQGFESTTTLQDRDLPYSLALELVVEDRDVIRQLAEYPEGFERNQYALEALKIGVLALRHVGGQISADLIQREGARVVKDMQRTLEQHMQLMHGRLGDALKEYFDPESGRFNERVQRLVGQDGELSSLIKGFIDGENSQLARTMVTQISPLMKQLDPQQSEGLLAVLRASVEAQLNQHRNHVLKEFSLDYKDGALCRLITELTTKHGDLSKDLQVKIDAVVKEFSLNEEGSALSRLVQNVNHAQRTITNEFSLDSETSCLSRLKREIFELLAATEQKNQLFQEEVKVSLAKIVTTREAAERSPRHGMEFETAVCEYLARETQPAGDIAISTAHTTGLIKNCKVGDCVIELGPDSAAPGAKIVVEAKEEIGYSLARAREEIEQARKNRGAQWGLFVFSKKTAPPGIDSFQRYGNDFFVVWDAEDCLSDVFVKAGILSCRSLCVKGARQSAAQQVDFDAIERAICEIEKRAANLDEVGKFAETIKSSSNKILDRVRIDREAFEKQVELLREHVTDLKVTVAPAP